MDYLESTSAIVFEVVWKLGVLSEACVGLNNVKNISWIYILKMNVLAV